MFRIGEIACIEPPAAAGLGGRASRIIAVAGLEVVRGLRLSGKGVRVPGGAGRIQAFVPYAQGSELQALARIRGPTFTTTEFHELGVKRDELFDLADYTGGVPGRAAK